MSKIALIPARKGSKGIPKKNIVDLLGKPLIAWTIETAKSCKLIDRVIVSTDDSEIASVSREYGADVPFIRPHELAEDASRDIEYHNHALEWLINNESYKPYAIVNLRPTTPLRNPNIIDEAIKLFFKYPEFDSLRSIQVADQNPYKMWTFDRNQLKQIAFLSNKKEPYNEPRQKLPISYWQNGYIDIVKSDVVINKKSTSGSKILGFLIEDPSIDLDYPEDIPIAEMQLKNFLSKSLINKNKNNNKNIKRYPS